MVKTSSFNYAAPDTASLSVIIPSYKAEQWIGSTIEKLWFSLKNTIWKSVEILVIDDGSSDKTAEVAERIKTGAKLRVIRQKNTGRLKARTNGIDAATGDYIFMLDSRVYTEPGAFEYLVKTISSKAVVWNGHIIVERRGNPFARFWYTVTFMAWRKYMKSPALTHYGTSNFDYYPKGAGCFFAPRQYLLDAYAEFQTDYTDDRFANDDTSLIRHVAAQSDIYLSPDFAFTYNSRSTWKAFLRHTLHRGVVFIDGYFRPGTRYFFAAIIYLISVPIFLGLIVIKPALLLLIIPAIIASFVLPLALGVTTADAGAFAYVLPIFSVYYTVVLYKGFLMKLGLLKK